MEEKIPYIAFESQMARNERHIKRLVIALIVAIVLMFASNGLWLWAWLQYDYVDAETESVSIDNGEGNANYIRNGGIISNGKDSSEKDENEIPNEINREEK